MILIFLLISSFSLKLFEYESILSIFLILLSIFLIIKFLKDEHEVLFFLKQLL